MKKLFNYLGLPGFVFLLAIALFVISFFESCKSVTPKFTPKTDTVDVIVQSYTDGPFILKGVYSTVRVLISTDSASTDAKWLIDTIWRVRISIDTLRDVNHHPLFDSLHRPIPNWSWQVADKHFIQIKNVPRK